MHQFPVFTVDRQASKVTRHRRKQRTRAVIALALVAIVIGGVLAASPTAGASHFYNSGWRDKHVTYPPVPYGYSGIVSVFGQPCNSQVNVNRTNWVAQDNGVSYRVNYHYKLGGWGPYYGGDVSPGPSSNLNNDVRGHIRNDHLYHYVYSGIYGYYCRFIPGTSKYSAHAWGIAVDINSASNPRGKYPCALDQRIANVWKAHGWKWGAVFSTPDCMHFQYATGY